MSVGQRPAENGSTRTTCGLFCKTVHPEFLPAADIFMRQHYRAAQGGA
jgi:hypothetical protein